MNRPLYVRGTMVEDGQVRDLVIVDGVVADATPLPSREPDAVGWVLPGLADVHNHLSLASPAGDDEEPTIRVRASASVELAVGVLAIREPGSPDDASMLLAGEAGWPRVVTAGRFLAPPGGYFPGLARELTCAELARAAVEGAARSGQWAKIIGDFLGGADEFVPNWPADVLAEAVAQVHAAGGRVAVHAVYPEAVDAAVAAGVDSVEHGWAVSDAHFAAMRARDVAWVPTLMPGGSDAACEFAAAMGFSTGTREWMRHARRTACSGGAGGCGRRDGPGRHRRRPGAAWRHRRPDHDAGRCRRARHCGHRRRLVDRTSLARPGMSRIGRSCRSGPVRRGPAC
jgi:hypothetical protein